jgi:hypothetical protein
MIIKRDVATLCDWLAASAKDAIPQCRIGYTLRCRVSSGLYPQAYRGRGREEKQGTPFCRVAGRLYPHWGILGRSISGSVSKGKDEVHGYEGARFIKAMMTVVTTLKQHRHVLGSMTDACQSAHTPSDLVVAHWTSDVESTASLAFLLRHDLWTPFGCLMSCKIRSIISAACDFTTKSDGIWLGHLPFRTDEPAGLLHDADS